MMSLCWKYLVPFAFLAFVATLLWQILVAAVFCANVAHLATVPPRAGGLVSALFLSSLAGALGVGLMQAELGVLLLGPIIGAPLVVAAMIPAVFLTTLVASAEKVAARRSEAADVR